MLAVGMNGEQLPREHGFPVRMVIPGLYGFIGATKWVTRLTLTTYDDQTGLLDRARTGPPTPRSRSPRGSTPRRPLAQLDPGDAVVGGVAWAQERGGIAKVRGPHRRRSLGRTPSSGRTAATTTGGSGSYRWPAESGSHRIAVRAVSGDGEPQTAVRAEPFPERRQRASTSSSSP